MCRTVKSGFTVWRRYEQQGVKWWRVLGEMVIGGAIKAEEEATEKNTKSSKLDTQ
jgi:hypothetical protein